MNKKSHSIKYRTTAVLVILFVLFAAFLFSLIYTIGGYSKQMKFYTQNYYRVIKINSSVNSFNGAVERYVKNNTKENGEVVSDAFAQFRDDLKELHSVRFKLEDDLRYDIEEA